MIFNHAQFFFKAAMLTFCYLSYTVKMVIKVKSKVQMKQIGKTADGFTISETPQRKFELVYIFINCLKLFYDIYTHIKEYI